MKRTVIVFALFWELWPFARKLGIPLFKATRKRIVIEDRNIAIIRCGMGRKKAQEAARKVIEDFRPEVIISAGFCGALCEDLKVGDVVISNLTDGKVFCSPDPLCSYEDKVAAQKRYNAIVVDMESEGVAAAAKEHRVDFVAVKAVSDGLKDDIPGPINMISSPSRLSHFKRNAALAADRLAEFLFEHVIQS